METLTITHKPGTFCGNCPAEGKHWMMDCEFSESCSFELEEEGGDLLEPPTPPTPIPTLGVNPPDGTTTYTNGRCGFCGCDKTINFLNIGGPIFCGSCFSVIV